MRLAPRPNSVRSMQPLSGRKAERWRAKGQLRTLSAEATFRWRSSQSNLDPDNEPPGTECIVSVCSVPSCSFLCIWRSSWLSKSALVAAKPHWAFCGPMIVKGSSFRLDAQPARTRSGSLLRSTHVRSVAVDVEAEYGRATTPLHHFVSRPCVVSRTTSMIGTPFDSTRSDGSPCQTPAGSIETLLRKPRS